MAYSCGYPDTMNKQVSMETNDRSPLACWDGYERVPGTKEFSKGSCRKKQIIMKLPSNGVAKELRHYIGSLFIFLFVIGIIIVLIQFPVLDTNKEVVMMLICTISASIGIVVSTITGAKPDDVTALKTSLEKKEHHIELLVSAKDQLEQMVINLQKQMLDNQDAVMDKIILKAAMDFDDKNNPPKCECGDKSKNECNCKNNEE